MSDLRHQVRVSTERVSFCYQDRGCRWSCGRRAADPRSAPQRVPDGLCKPRQQTSTPVVRRQALDPQSHSPFRAADADSPRGAGSGFFGVRSCRYSTYGVWRPVSDGSNPNWVGSNPNWDGSNPVPGASPAIPVVAAAARASQSEFRAACRRFKAARAVIRSSQIEYRSARTGLAWARSRFREPGAELRRRRIKCHTRHSQSRRARRQLAATHRQREQAVSILRAARLEVGAWRVQLRRHGPNFGRPIPIRV